MDNRISLLQSIIKIFGVEPRLCENRSLFKMSSKPRFQRSPLNRNEQMGKGIRFQNPLDSLITPKHQRSLQHSPHLTTSFPSPPKYPLPIPTNPHQSPPIQSTQATTNPPTTAPLHLHVPNITVPPDFVALADAALPFVGVPAVPVVSVVFEEPGAFGEGVFVSLLL